MQGADDTLPFYLTQQTIIMKLDIKEVKRILYRLEDITELGTQLPIVAFQQLKQHLSNMDTQDVAIGIQRDEVEQFISRYQEDYLDKDERALSRAFIRLKKKHADRLEAYRRFYELLGWPNEQ